MAPETTRYFAIEGNIGSGKTTLLRRMQERNVPLQVIMEPVEVWQKLGDGGSNILDLFYKSPAEWAMPFQLITLITRLERWSQHKGQLPVVSERSIDGDFQIFGK
jgi:deoxyguanosine kinase